MKIADLSFLKPNKIAQIVSIQSNGGLSSQKIERLYSIGICPGENITIQNRVKDLYIVKTDRDNPFCMREDVIKSIKIQADNDCFYSNLNIRKKEDSFLSLIKNFLNNIFKK